MLPRYCLVILLGAWMDALACLASFWETMKLLSCVCIFFLQRKEVIEATARTMARFHSVPIPNVLQGREPHVWARVNDWMEQVQDTFQDDITTQQ